MYPKPFSRVWEKALGIIGIVLNMIVIILTVLAISEVGSGTFEADLQEIVLSDPALSAEDAEAMVAGLGGLAEAVEVFGWIIIALLVLSTILAVIAVISLNDNKKPKLAGILFVIAGILSGIISLTALVFYVAAIMCFVRRPPLGEELVGPEEPLSNTADQSPYRPL